MDYDQDFEDLWNSRYAWPPVKKTYYEVWQAAKATKPEKQKIELQGGVWAITGYLYVFHEVTCKKYRDSGRERKTEADAKKAAEAMRRRDRLAAFVYEHCGFEAEWGKQCNHYIYIDNDGEYCYVPEAEFPVLCKQYMPKETAIWLCEKLNSGEIVL